MALDNKFNDTLYYESEPLETSFQIIPSETALLIVDLQKQFVLRDYGDALVFKEKGIFDKWIPFHDRLDNIVVPNNKKLLNLFRSHKMEVTYGRIACHHTDGRDRSLVQKRSGWNNILLTQDSYGAEIIDELKPLDSEIVINKTTDSVTVGTNYCSILRNMGIRTVVVTGIVTDQCVASTVRGLADEGFNVVVIEDGCAAATEDVHNAELKIINKIYCEILSTDQVIELMNNL
ncbi:cysteine hydrolase family protein [Clostridium magnum]|uniref:Isochorismatase family protein YecD n=1 Tax=Clostridium magnum DSM 2767 TaxID=1121326 RepID=A0A162QVE8_9CLOT|nr:isochorismatase family cysteine hydrolase [Clostridium magnum]KZL89021.1 isochorismatase family protein YecD [Clostridium magnum DSM 2767]SHI23233.1 Nicotinamidase-related amidase [Clostridium magnum DSM 2767]